MRLAIRSTIVLGSASLIVLGLAARGESPAAFDGRCIPAGCVAPPSNISDILGRRALPAGRLARLGATLDFHHGLLGSFAGRADETGPLRFAISFPASRSAQPLDGRVLLFISDDGKAEPRTQTDQYRANSTKPIFGVDVDGLQPGADVIVDEKII